MSCDSPNARADEVAIGALLRAPLLAIHRRVIRQLLAEGYSGLGTAHLAILIQPSPDHLRPGALAARTGMSKQAMNRLLRSLEDSGYVVRSNDPAEGRARIVEFTVRGSAALERTREILRSIEGEWRLLLGAERLELLKDLLRRVGLGPLARVHEVAVEAETAA
jgi:DNA-binding MarR family transcriptional regulator